MLACVEKVSAQVRRKRWDHSNDNLVEDDVNCGNASLNEDIIVAAKNDLQCESSVKHQLNCVLITSLEFQSLVLLLQN